MMFQVLLVALLALAGVMNGPANAGSFNISPIKIMLPPDGSPMTVRVRNMEANPVLVQVEARDWATDIDSAPRSSEVIAVPPVVNVPGNGEQVIRLALRRPLAGDRERAFRLLVSEVPRPRAPDEQGVSMSLRLALPVFVTPRGASPETSWEIVRAPGEEIQLVATNSGSAHVLLTALEAADAAMLEGATYVLAGESRSWPLGKKLSELPEAIEVRAETNHGPIVAQVRPGG